MRACREDYEDEPQLLELWDKGFREREAQTLQAGDLIAYWETDVFQLGTVGTYHLTRVTAKVWDHGDFSLWHGDGSTDCDEADLVWSKREGGIVDELISAEGELRCSESTTPASSSPG